MRMPPTDLEILTAIYRRYYDDFANFKEGDRAAKIYVPVNFDDLAADLGTDAEIVFGRLYFDLDKRHAYKMDDGSSVNFFVLNIGGDKHCVHFTYLASVLAELRDRRRRFWIANVIATASFIVALAALLISLLSDGTASPVG